MAVARAPNAANEQNTDPRKIEESSKTTGFANARCSVACTRRLQRRYWSLNLGLFQHVVPKPESSRIWNWALLCCFLLVAAFWIHNFYVSRRSYIRECKSVQLGIFFNKSSTLGQPTNTLCPRHPMPSVCLVSKFRRAPSMLWPTTLLQRFIVPGTPDIMLVEKRHTFLHTQFQFKDFSCNTCNNYRCCCDRPYIRNMYCLL